METEGTGQARTGTFDRIVTDGGADASAGEYP